MSACPCCGEILLRHARHSGVYWFCTHCWQEMPALAFDKLQIRYDFSQPANLDDLVGNRSTLTA